MLVIRNQQRAMLGRPMRDAFVHKVVLHLRRELPEQLLGIPEPTLLLHICAALDDAAGFGLVTERDCADFLLLAAGLGWRLRRGDAESWMIAVLDDADTFVPAERLRRLADEMSRRRAVAANNHSLAACFSVGP